jgi:hypothetical protein
MNTGLAPYLLTALPPLTDREAPPAMSVAEFRDVVGATAAGPLTDAVLLADDLRLMQSIAAGADPESQPEPWVLNSAQLRGDAPLPFPFGDDGIGSDGLWLAYWQWAGELARHLDSDALQAWVAWEALLHGTVMNWRAQTQGRSVQWPAVLKRLVSGEQTDLIEAADLEVALGHSDNPLASQQAVDAARWDWLEARDPRFTFSNDELVIYAARLALATRWQRILREGDAPVPEVAQAVGATR